MDKIGQQVNLNKFPHFSQHLDKLNRLARLHPDFMPHQIANATGCTVREAVELLFFLYNSYLGNLFLLVYHTSSPTTPMFERDISDGPIQFPLMNPLTETKIHDPDDLLYDYMFEPQTDIQFVSEPE